MAQPRHSRIQTIQRMLSDLCQEHGLEAAVLAGVEGLPLAAASPAYDAETLAAVIARLQRAGGQAQGQLSWPALDEVSVAATGGSRLVGRCFSVSDQALILTVVIPGRAPYRRATNRAIRAIRRAWEGR